MLVMVCDYHFYDELFGTTHIISSSFSSSFIWYASIIFLRVSDIPLIETCLAIPTVLDGGNHTTPFAKAVVTTEAHHACLDVCKALAATSVRVLIDDTFFAEVWFHSWWQLGLWPTNVSCLGRQNIRRRWEGTWIALKYAQLNPKIWNEICISVSLASCECSDSSKSGV